jgi:hypothetical protein
MYKINSRKCPQQEFFVLHFGKDSRLELDFRHIGFGEKSKISNKTSQIQAATKVGYLNADFSIFKNPFAI